MGPPATGRGPLLRQGGAARSLLEPMRQYLHELDQEKIDAEVTAIDSGDRPRRHRPSAA